jgi:hypothetical protein
VEHEEGKPLLRPVDLLAARLPPPAPVDLVPRLEVDEPVQAAQKQENRNPYSRNPYLDLQPQLPVAFEHLPEFH